MVSLTFDLPRRRALIAALASLLLCACASYDGRGLLVGQSTEAEVAALMGQPAERATAPDGGSVLYFPRQAGRQTYVARLGKDGRLLGIEQVLTLANINSLVTPVPDTTQVRSTFNDPQVRGPFDKAQIRALFGPPFVVSFFPRQAREVWEYKWLDYADPRVLWVYFSDDGIVREVTNMHDFTADAPGGRRGRR